MLLSRFDSEMKRMEEEMNRFRSELISRQADTFRKTSTRYPETIIAFNTRKAASTNFYSNKRKVTFHVHHNFYD